MNTLKISKKKVSLNEIENFIDDICDNHYIQNSIQGNLIIAITEMVSIVTNIGGDGKLIFENKKNDFSFKYEFDSIPADIDTIISKEQKNSKMESDYEKSIFLIMGLCDDLNIDKVDSSISVTFKKAEIEKELTSHRKEYLKTYLGKTIESIR